MYSYLAKGSTVGQLLTRRLLRTLFGMPGFILDAVIAIFWLPNYFSYWKNPSISYADGVTAGFYQCLTGWIGEIAGFLLGSVIGAVLGLTIYALNSCLWLCRISQQALYNSLDVAAALIGERSFFEHFFTFNNPTNYLQKAFNLGAGGIGSLIALIPWTIAKAIEFFIPVLAPYLSQGITFLSSLIGAGSMLLIAIPLFPVIYTIERIGTLYDLTCLKCRDLIAIIYGKCNEKLYSTNSKEDIPNETVHSKEFRAKVEEVKKTPWTDLLFGVVKEDNQSTETIYFDHLVVGSGTLYPTLQPRDDVAAPGNPTFNFASK